MPVEERDYMREGREEWGVPEPWYERRFRSGLSIKWAAALLVVLFALAELAPGVLVVILALVVVGWIVLVIFGAVIEHTEP